MRIAKKIVWVILAILPIMSFLWVLIGQIGQQKNNVMGVDGYGFIPIWTDLNIYEVDGDYYIEEYGSEESIATFTTFCITAFANNGMVNKNSVKGAFCGLYNILDNECKIPAPTITFFGMLYIFYLAFLEIVSLIIDFIMFIPRKCAEIFR